MSACGGMGSRDADYGGVRLDNRNGTDRPVIEPDTLQAASVEINGAVSEGPPSIKTREPVIALILGPGGYKTIAYIGVLKAIERAEINVKIVSGHGMGALIASIYARSPSSGRAEWVAFNLMEKIKDSEAFYSNNWNQKIQEFIKDEFKETNIQDLKLTLLLPIENERRGETTYIKRGKIKEILPTSLYLYEKERQLLANNQKKAFFGQFPFKKNGADIVFSLNVLGDKVIIERVSGYITGHFTLLSSLIKKEMAYRKNLFTMKLGRRALDSKQSLASFLLMGEDHGKNFVVEMKKTIEAWRENKGTL